VTGLVVGLDVIFPPERHVFRHADEVQFALLFDVESPEVPYCGNTKSRPNVPALPGSCKHIMHSGFASTCGSLSSAVAPMPACPGLLWTIVHSLQYTRIRTGLALVFKQTCRLHAARYTTPLIRAVIQHETRASANSISTHLFTILKCALKYPPIVLRSCAASMLARSTNCAPCILCTRSRLTTQELLSIFGAGATIEVEIDWDRRSSFPLAPDLSVTIPSLSEGPHMVKAWVASPSTPSSSTIQSPSAHVAFFVRTVSHNEDEVDDDSAGEAGGAHEGGGIERSLAQWVSSLMSLLVQVYIQTYTYIQTFIYIYVHRFMYVYTCIHMYIYVHLCIHTYII